MSSAKSRNKKQSVNPAKNAAIQKQSQIAKESKTSSSSYKQPSGEKTADKSNYEKVNNLDKNKLKNRKLRRELKKALNSDSTTLPKKKTSSQSSEDTEVKTVKPSKKNDLSKNNSKTLEVNDVNDDKELEPVIEDDPEQEHAPERVEFVKQHFHLTIGSSISKALKKISPFPALKSIVQFWGKQFKKLSISQVAFLVVSVAIVFAFVVPPVWSAIEFYRSGMWSLFG